MAADGYLNFDTKIKTDGFKTGVKNVSKLLGGVKTSVAGIGDIFESITHWQDEISASWAEWADTVDFAPFLDAVGNFLPKVERLTDLIGAAFKYVSEKILQPLASWLIESGIPTALDAISAALDTLMDTAEIVGTPIKIV